MFSTELSISAAWLHLCSCHPEPWEKKGADEELCGGGSEDRERGCLEPFIVYSHMHTCLQVECATQLDCWLPMVIALQQPAVTIVLYNRIFFFPLFCNT